MPTVHREDGFRFYFYSHEPNEPAHVHVDRAGASAKLWLRPVAVAANLGFNARELRSSSVARATIEFDSLRHGMTISAARADTRVKDVEVSDTHLIVALVDGRTISVPLSWFPRLRDATPTQRAHWQLAGSGYGIHWPEIDEDLSTEGLLRGAASVG